ncbi:MAG: transglutaminase family protein [Thermodesulfobacteriota bacterium]|nr:transglutaminase family protein [Thermodesulfobacteriota bacterium]
MKKYLSSTYFIDIGHPRVASMARDAVGDATTQRDKAVKLFYAVRDGIKYNPWVEAYKIETNIASHIIEYGQGYCVQKAIVLIALARHEGIPARLGLADIINHRSEGALLEAMGTNLFTCHGYAELYLDEQWIKATPAFDIEMCEKKSFPPVGFDGRGDAVFPSTDKKGRRYVEYVTFHGVFADLPFEFIMDKWEETYPDMNGVIEKKE